MIVLQYDPYTQTAKFQNQNEENGHVSDFIHLSKEQKDALNMLKKDIILQNQIENLLLALKEIDSSQSFRFIGTTKDYRDFSEGVKHLAPGGVVKKTDSPFFYDATYIRDQLTSICDAVRKDVETLNQKYPEHGGILHFDSTGINAALNDRTPLVFMGKGSAGKSSVINALIGAEVLPTGDGTTTEAVCEIIPEEYIFEVSCRQGDSAWKFDLNKTKEDAELSLTNAFGCEISFETENRYDWVYRTVEVINEQDDIANFQIRIPFKNLAAISKQIVIYDTPGPDSKTRLNHKNVLNEALRQFKKGVAVFVTGPKDIEKITLRSFLKEYTENSKELLEVLNVNAGIVIINGADMSNIPKINEGKKSRKKNLQKADDDIVRLEFQYEQDRMIYFSSPYALGIHKEQGEKWMDSEFKKINRHPEYLDTPDDEDYLPLATVAELPFLRKKAVCAAYQAAEQRYLNDKSEENRKELIAHNSGLRALEYELGFVVNELSICNLCAQAQRQLEIVLSSVKRGADEISKEINTQELNYKKLVDEKYAAIFKQLFDEKTNSVLTSEIKKVNDYVSNFVDEDENRITNAPQTVVKEIMDQWSAVKKAPITTIKSIIMKNEAIAAIQTMRNNAAVEYYKSEFEVYKKRCQEIVYQAELNKDEQKMLEECMSHWKVISIDKGKICISEQDIQKRFIFKFISKEKCYEKAKDGAFNVLRDHKLKVANAVKELFRASCIKTKNSFYTEERIKSVNPELKVLSKKIAILEAQQKEYGEFQEKVKEHLTTVSGLTQLQQKGTV